MPIALSDGRGLSENGLMGNSKGFPGVAFPSFLQKSSIKKPFMITSFLQEKGADGIGFPDRPCAGAFQMTAGIGQGAPALISLNHARPSMRLLHISVRSRPLSNSNTALI
ncbi:hypothetical protein [Novacetimonas pomaceti]|uniref:hypothetical protein n=1 Tax=Novacetimonas pomaceti TaxID=2021998 RepID=UPI0010579A3C|nr:hypothetical protein [Novacetimonas pomaceti]